MDVINEIDQIVAGLYLFFLRITEFVTFGRYEKRRFRPKGRIAIIGAGHSGITAACHCISSGFEVTLFESTPYVGGQWRANEDNELYPLQYIPPMSCSSFHPVSVLESIRSICNKYSLDLRTRFNNPVLSIARSATSDVVRDGHSKWIVNDVQNEVFDAVICATGNCEQWDLSGLSGFGGKIIAARQLQSMKSLEGLKVVIVGDGVEAVLTLEKAFGKRPESIALIGLDRKWSIPKYYTVAILRALLPDRIRYKVSNRLGPVFKDLFFYSSLDDFSKKKYASSTPLKVMTYTSQIHHANESVLCLSNDIAVEADVVIISTPLNLSKPVTVPQDIHNSPLFLSNFSQQDISILRLTSSSFHLPFSTRLLLLFLSKPETIPSSPELKKWAEWTQDLPWILKLFSFLILHPFRVFWVWYVLGGFWGPRVWDLDDQNWVGQMKGTRAA